MKPRLTNRVVDGIISACAILLAGDIASAFGIENPETIKDWENVCAAERWAKEMREYREHRKSTEE